MNTGDDNNFVDTILTLVACSQKIKVMNILRFLKREAALSGQLSGECQKMAFFNLHNIITVN